MASNQTHLCTWPCQQATSIQPHMPASLQHSATHASKPPAFSHTCQQATSIQPHMALSSNKDDLANSNFQFHYSKVKHKYTMQVFHCTAQGITLSVPTTSSLSRYIASMRLAHRTPTCTLWPNASIVGPFQPPV